MENEEKQRLIYGFGKLIGNVMETLNEISLKIISTIVLHPQGARWKEFEAAVGKEGGDLNYWLKQLIQKGIIMKKVYNGDTTYHLTKWGWVIFDFSKDLAIRLQSMQSPPSEYMSKEEFEELRSLTNKMLNYLKDNKYEELYIEPIIQYSIVSKKLEKQSDAK